MKIYVEIKILQSLRIIDSYITINTSQEIGLMSNLMSEESLNSYPILRSDESSVSKHLLIIYPLVPRPLVKELY